MKSPDYTGLFEAIFRFDMIQSVGILLLTVWLIVITFRNRR